MRGMFEGKRKRSEWSNQWIRSAETTKVRKRRGKKGLWREKVWRRRGQEKTEGKKRLRK